MASLEGRSVASSYKDLLQVSNSNSGIDGTARVVSDGEDTASKLFLDTNRVGVGIAPTDGTLHVHTATAGSIGADSACDDLVVENSASGGISILTPNDALGQLAFGSPADAYGAFIGWKSDDNQMTIATANAGDSIVMQTANKVTALTIDSSQNVGIGGAPSAPVHVSIPAQNGVSSPIEALRLEVSESHGNVDVGSNQGPAIDFYVPVDSNTSQIGGRIAVGHENGTDSDSSAKLTFTTAPDGSSLNASPALTIDSSQNVGIGTDNPQSLVDISASTNNDYPLIVRGDIDNDGGYTGIAFNYNGATTSYEKAVIHVQGTSGNIDPEMHFLINSDGGTTNATIADAVLSLKQGGNIDANANYIVNEQGTQNHVANTMSSPYYRFDKVNDVITVADSAVYEFGTSDFAISLWIYFENTVANQGIWEKRTDASNQIRVYTDADSNLNLLAKTSGSTRIHAETSGGLSAGEWYHLAIVCDRDSGNTIYINGVSQTLINNTKDDGAYSMAFGATTIGRSESSAQYFGGSMTSLMLHNHALDSTEVKELYSGISVPYKYKGANQTDLVTSNFVNNGSFPFDTFTGASADGFTAVRSTSGTKVAGTADEIVLVKGKSYRVSFDVTLTSGTFPLARVRESQTSGTLIEIVSTGGASDGDKINFEFTATASGTYVVSFESSNSVSFAIANFNFVQIGAVAEYDGSGIASDEWFDKSGNDLHGTVSGASVENAPSGDDGLVFETGTFTPTLTTNSTDFTSVTYDSLVSGRYSRVGNTVHIQGFMRTDAINKGSASGDVAIGGLPFSAVTNTSGTANGQASISISNASGWTGENPSHGLIIQTTTLIQLYYADYNVDANNIAVADVTDGTSADKNALYFAGTYTI